MTFRTLSLLMLLTVAVGGAAAQPGGVQSGGCSQSPENPTAVLSLLGAGGFAAAAFRGRVSSLLAKKRSR